MKDLLKPLAKSVLIPLELNTAALATNAAIENNFSYWIQQHDYFQMKISWK